MSVWPTSSPQMMTMFGFLSCALAVLGAATTHVSARPSMLRMSFVFMGFSFEMELDRTQATEEFFRHLCLLLLGCAMRMKSMSVSRSAWRRSSHAKISPAGQAGNIRCGLTGTIRQGEHRDIPEIAD